MDNQLVSLWGAPDSGVTTTAVKMAKVLADDKKDVLLVLCNNTVPEVPLLLPKRADTPSLGELLAQPGITQMDVFRHCIPFDKKGHINLLGYAYGENETSYVPYSEEQANTFLRVLRSCADYIIVAGYHALTQSILTGAALKSSDCTVKILNADLKSGIFLNSQKTFLIDESFRYDKQINVLNNVWPGQATAPYEAMLGSVLCTIPHLEALREQCNDHSLLDSLLGRDAKYYNPMIRGLVQEVFFKNDES